MRATLLLSALLLAPLAAAQSVVVDTSEETIENGYRNFAQDAYGHWAAYPNDALLFTLTGSETSGGATTSVRAFLYWRLGYDARTGKNSRAQVELDVYDLSRKDVPLSLRIVGDGLNLYRYDMAKGLVSTTTYGFAGTKVPANYAGSDGPRLLAQLRAATPGLANYLVRLVGELNLSGAEFDPLFNDWLPVSAGVDRLRRPFDLVPLPMRRPNQVLEASTVVDPISGATFVRGNDPYVFYGMDSTRTDRTVTFHLTDVNADPNNPRYEVQTVALAQRTPDRAVSLAITPPTITPSAMATPGWVFAPYTGAQAAAFRPVNTGGH